MAKIFQEFYCTKSGGGCGKYILVKLNITMDHIVEVVCPNCGHKHQRKIENGQIKEGGRWDGKPVEELCPPKSAVSDEPHSAKFRDGTSYERDGAVIKDQKDLHKSSPHWERWFERFGGGYDAAQE
jgi:hypothetical protein